MDRVIAAKLTPGHRLHDPSLAPKLVKIAGEYVKAGFDVLEYFVADFDAAHDVANCFAPLKTPDIKSLDRTAPSAFTLPMTATEVTTLATFVSQILFGGQTSRRVEGREDTDDKGADAVNELLQWNDDQQPTYLQGYLWLIDAMTFNRGIMYDHWQDIVEVSVEPVFEPDPDLAEGEEPPPPAEGQPPDPNAGKVPRFKKVRKTVGGFNRIELVSPYDFYSDPMIPLLRFQEGRFAGHRVMIPWIELERRSKLKVTDYDYVSPEVVEKLKTKNTSSNSGSTLVGSPSKSLSRSYHERQRRSVSQSPLDGTNGAVNREDGGVCECFATIIRSSPASLGIYEEDEQLEHIELLTSGEELLSCNILPNKHDQFPYAVGEARPHAHYQFSPSWALIIRPIQDYVDYLKERRKESIARTSGNIFIGDATKVDFAAFTDPNKDGLFIPITEEGRGTPVDQIIKQVSVTDMTANFHAEMMMWIQQAETATGAHAFTQGQTDDTEQTATQFVGVQQMATGRISTMARNLSVGALTSQTRRFVENFQQFLPDEMIVRITGDPLDFDPDAPVAKSKVIRRQDIQHSYDYIPHDGALPGTDARKVAALSRAIEVYGTNPAFAGMFDDTIPGNIDPKRVLFESLKASGMRMSNYRITKEQAQKNLMAKMQANGQPMMTGPNGAPISPTAAPIPQGAETPMLQTDAGNIPSAAQVPPLPTAEPPGVSPATV